VAEKFQAMVAMGIANSRMKDFYDVWTLAQQFEFDGTLLSSAIRATFERRQTPIPNSPPPFNDVVRLLQDFLMPPTIAIPQHPSWPYSWTTREWRRLSET
jgi:hypothetical protein